MNPKLAMCNFIADLQELREFALEHDFSGIDWSFDIDDLPGTPAQESRWIKALSLLSPLEVRYHCPFSRQDLGHEDPDRARAADALFRRIVRLVAKAGGKFLTLHVGLGHDSTRPLSWEETIASLRRLVRYGADRQVRLCLENLAWGWTSKPNLFEKMVRRSGAGVTLDIGHSQACESVRNHYYEFKDFIAPHAERVYNAHVYHTEVSGVGHLPPDAVEQIKDRLDSLMRIGCSWWVLELREKNGLLQAKSVVDDYLAGRAAHPAVGGTDPDQRGLSSHD